MCISPFLTFLSAGAIFLSLRLSSVLLLYEHPLTLPQNYHWWWQSFLVGSASALWIFAYLAYYFLTKLHITGFVSSMLFFAYGALACAVYGLLVGTVGFLASYTFVRRIYSAVKVD